MGDAVVKIGNAAINSSSKNWECSNIIFNPAINERKCSNKYLGLQQLFSHKW